MNLSEYILDFLVRMSVNHVFGLSGARIETFFHEIHKSDSEISLVTAKHEFSAAAMASSYAGCGKAFGVVATTSGGAAFNIIPALAEAYTGKIPLLALIGQPPNNRKLYGAFQETSGSNGTPDLLKSLEPVSRICCKIESADEFQDLLERIHKLFIIDKTGPAVVLIPDNLFTEETGQSRWEEPKINKDSISKTETEGHKTYTGKTLIIAGKEIIKEGAQELFSDLVNRLRCPVVSTPDAKDVFDNFSPYYKGSIGIMGNPSAHRAVEEAETLIVAGAELNETAMYGLRETIIKKKILYTGKLPVFFPHYSHINKSLACGFRYLSENIRTGKCEIEDGITYLGRTENPYTRIMKIIESDILSPSNISVDAGLSGVYAVHNIKVPAGTRFSIALSAGGMGFSFGSIIGSVISNGRKGYLIAGDGSFFMNGFEIHTAVEMNLPIIFIILNNSGYKICSLREKIFFNEISGENDFLDTFIGRGFNEMFPSLKSFDIETPEELESILKKNRILNAPVLISIKTDNSEIPPYLPFHEKKE